MAKKQVRKKLKMEYFQGGSFLEEQYYVDQFPSTKLYRVAFKTKINPSKEIVDQIVQLGFDDIFIGESQRVLVKDDTLLMIGYDSYIESGVYIFSRRNENPYVTKIEKIVAKFNDNILEDNNVYLLMKSSHSLTKKPSKIQLPVVDITNDYELSVDYKKITSAIESNKPGLILFSGIPGTGKSFLIKHLISTYRDKTFVYLPVDVVGILSDPGFTNFCLDQLKNSILIIEDAETILLDRQKAHNNAASTILNVTDGILGDLLGIKIIATINIEDSVDHALLRQGRLLIKSEFQKLPIEKANKILKRLGRDSSVSEPTTIADLYSSDDNGGKIIQRRRIGF